MAIVNKLPSNVTLSDKWITEEPAYDVDITLERVIIKTKNPIDPVDKLIVRTYNDTDQNITTGTIASPVQQLPKSVDVGDTLVIRTKVTSLRFYEDLTDPYGWGTLIAEVNNVPLDPTLQIKIDTDPGVLA
jgi:hypothetical protein